MLRSAAAKAARKSRVRIAQGGANTVQGSLQNEASSHGQYRSTLPIDTTSRTDIRTSMDSVRKRSFLLDPPSKPPPKRMLLSRVLPAESTAFERRMANNPYASILATPIRQCLYTRRSLPNAFLTRLIQAAPESPEDHAWIVPEGIIPHEILTSSTPAQVSDRFGVSKWVYSGSKIMESMVREGKYKMMNSSAYARPDMAQLVYAQWTIRLAHDILELLKPTRVPLLPFVALTKDPSGYAIESKQLFHNPQSKGLQCVLYFKDAADTDPRANDDRSLELCSTSDISQPGLPTPMSRSLVLEEVIIRGKKGGPTTVPLYDMEQLFHNHPQGYKAILHACHKQLPTTKDQASGRDLRWVGIVDSQSTVPVAVGLWKLASMLPKEHRAS